MLPHEDSLEASFFSEMDLISMGFDANDALAALSCAGYDASEALKLFIGAQDALMAQDPARVPVRVMFGCVATACQRLSAAPAKVHVTCRTTWRWSVCIMERVTRGHVCSAAAAAAARFLCCSFQCSRVLCVHKCNCLCSKR